MKASFEYYRIFYFVTKYGSFSKAAKVLMTSQPAVTRAMHNLESELGCCLFTRTRSGVTLTPEGETLYKYVSTGCEQIFKGEDELSGTIGLQNGTVYLGATESALHCYLFDAMEKFNELYPNIHFKILNQTTHESIASLKNRLIDLAIVTSPITTSRPLVTRVLTSFQDILIVGKKYAFLADQEFSIVALAHYPFVCLPVATSSRDFFEGIFQEYNLELSPDIEPATADLLLPIIKHNLGLGFIPDKMAREDLQEHKLFEIKTLETIPQRNICLVYDQTHPQSIASRAFLSFLQK